MIGPRGTRMQPQTRPVLREVRPGRETLAAGLAMPRHRHADAYALVVVAGTLEQVSYPVCWETSPT